MKVLLVVIMLACSSAAPNQSIQEWVVSLEPVGQIELADQRDAPFGQSTTAVVLSDGRIVSIDQSRIHFHTTTGTRLAAVDIPPRADGLPESPLRLLRLAGDSVLALTDRESTILVDPDSRFVRRAPFRVDHMLPGGVGRIGEMLIDQTHAVIWGIEFESFPTDSLVRPAIRVIVANSLVDSVRSLGAWGGLEQLRKQSGTVVPRPLSPTTHITVGHGRIYIADSATPIVDVFSLYGESLRSIRLPLEAHAATDEMIQKDRSGWLDWRDSASRAIAERDLELVGAPELTPFHAGILVDATGNLWVRSFNDDGRSYTVVDSAGGLIARLTAPVVPVAVGADFILGRVDQSGATSLRLHRLRRE